MSNPLEHVPDESFLGVPSLNQGELDTLKQLSQIAQDLTGVQFSEKNYGMINSRLQRRLLDLKLKNLTEYLYYYKENLAQEKGKLIALLTTHHTFFFREFSHFEYLTNTLLPELIPEIKKRPDRKLRVWSAACSRGQEVYSLAMYIDQKLKSIDPTLSFEILGTDIDTESVNIAKNGLLY